MSDQANFIHAIEKLKTRLDGLASKIKPTNCATLESQAEDALAYCNHFEKAQELTDDFLIEIIGIVGGIGELREDGIDRRAMREHDAAYDAITECREWAEQQLLENAA